MMNFCCDGDIIFWVVLSVVVLFLWLALVSVVVVVVVRSSSSSSFVFLASVEAAFTVLEVL